MNYLTRPSNLELDVSQILLSPKLSGAQADLALAQLAAAEKLSDAGKDDGAAATEEIDRLAKQVSGVERKVDVIVFEDGLVFFDKNWEMSAKI